MSRTNGDERPVIIGPLYRNVIEIGIAELEDKVLKLDPPDVKTALLDGDPMAVDEVMGLLGDFVDVASALRNSREADENGRNN